MKSLPFYLTTPISMELLTDIHRQLLPGAQNFHLFLKETQLGTLGRATFAAPPLAFLRMKGKGIHVMGGSLFEVPRGGDANYGMWVIPLNPDIRHLDITLAQGGQVDRGSKFEVPIGAQSFVVFGQLVMPMEPVMLYALQLGPLLGLAFHFPVTLVLAPDVSSGSQFMAGHQDFVC